jgi:ribosomal protein S18 acetylase RimI-like enzyme
VEKVDDKQELAEFFGRDKPLHLYELGDLDPFFWPSTQWFGWRTNGELRAVALLYTGTDVPSLLLLERDDTRAAELLLEKLQPRLPARLHAHLSPGLPARLQGGSLTPHGRHLKMVAGAVDELLSVETESVESLQPSGADELKRFYDNSYPGNWFMPRMLETRQYFGMRAKGALVAVAGVHVYSQAYGVAALGNITTHPEHRGKGLGRLVTAKVCQSLLESVGTIGLNVRADNDHAIRCYRRLGFDVVAEYDEYTLEFPAR